MNEIGRSESAEFFGREPEHLLPGGVGFDDSSIRGEQGDADEDSLKDGFKPLPAFAERRQPRRHPSRGRSFWA